MLCRRPMDHEQHAYILANSASATRTPATVIFLFLWVTSSSSSSSYVLVFLLDLCVCSVYRHIHCRCHRQRNIYLLKVYHVWHRLPIISLYRHFIYHFHHRYPLLPHHHHGIWYLVYLPKRYKNISFSFPPSPPLSLCSLRQSTCLQPVALCVPRILPTSRCCLFVFVQVFFFCQVFVYCFLSPP